MIIFEVDKRIMKNNVITKQLDAFMEEIKKLNLPNNSLVLLNAIISIGSGNIFMNETLSEKTNLGLHIISRAKKPLVSLGVIKCERVFDNGKYIGTRITVNFDFKPATQADEDPSSLTEAEKETDPIRKDLLNNAQVAAILGIRVDTVTRLIKNGTLPKHNVVITQRLKFWSVDLIKNFLNLSVK